MAVGVYFILKVGIGADDNVCGLGLVIGVELVEDRPLEKGLNFKTTMANVLMLTPPLNISKDEMDRALDIIDDALGEKEAPRTPGQGHAE